MSRATVLELFAGTGGASLGLHRAGWVPLACIEREPAAVRTLRAAGLPGVEADVYTVDFSRWEGQVDLLWVSPPCQPGSVAGKRRGGEDERDGWPATLTAIDACKPAWFLAENVLGWSYHSDACSLDRGGCPACHYTHVLDQIGLRFAFTGVWRLDAASFGVPQRRRRLLVWGGPLPLDADGPTPTHAAPADADGLGLPPWVTLGAAVGETLTRESCTLRACYSCDGAHGRACPESWRYTLPAPTITTTEVKGTRASAQTAWSFNGGPDRASDAAFLAAGIRRITVAEALVLQGFPADWPLQGTIQEQYTQAGNAVPPPLAEAVARLVLVAHRVWRSLVDAGVDPRALSGTLRRRGLVVPGYLGVRP